MDPSLSLCKWFFEQWYTFLDQTPTDPLPTRCSLRNCLYTNTCMKQTASCSPWPAVPLPLSPGWRGGLPRHGILINTSINSSIIEFLLDWLALSHANCLSTLVQINPHWHKIVIRCLSSTPDVINEGKCIQIWPSESFHLPDVLSLSLQFIAAGLFISSPSPFIPRWGLSSSWHRGRGQILFTADVSYLS